MHGFYCQLLSSEVRSAHAKDKIVSNAQILIMPSKRRIPWNRRLGEIGQLAIKKRLSYFSNPMRPAIDIGIDFWCELIERDIPSSRLFLVQAKGTRHFDEKWGHSFDREIIEFWLNQIYPVYLVIYDENDKNCYWMSIEEHRKSLIEKLESLDKKTVYITVDRSTVLKNERNDEFVERVKLDLDLIDFKLSLIQGTPKLIGKGYVKRRPILKLPNEFVRVIRDRIRIGMEYLVINYSIFEKDLEQAYSLCKFLTEFDKSHYGHFVLFGQICRSLGKDEESLWGFQEAISICRRDNKWNKRKKPSDPSIEDIIVRIQKERDSLIEEIKKRKSL